MSVADHALGPPDATITLVEYADFECPYCRQAAMAVKTFLARFGWRRIRYVFRHFPIEQVHPHAMRAAEAAECAGAQGKFWEMHQLLFDINSSSKNGSRKDMQSACSWISRVTSMKCAKTYTSARYGSISATPGLAVFALCLGSSSMGAFMMSLTACSH